MAVAGRAMSVAVIESGSIKLGQVFSVAAGATPQGGAWGVCSRHRVEGLIDPDGNLALSDQFTEITEQAFTPDGVGAKPFIGQQGLG